MTVARDTASASTLIAVHRSEQVDFARCSQQRNGRQKRDHDTQSRGEYLLEQRIRSRVVMTAYTHAHAAIGQKELFRRALLRFDKAEERADHRRREKQSDEDDIIQHAQCPQDHANDRARLVLKENSTYHSLQFTPHFVSFSFSIDRKEHHHHHHTVIRHENMSTR